MVRELKSGAPAPAPAGPTRRGPAGKDREKNMKSNGANSPSPRRGAQRDGGKPGAVAPPGGAQNNRDRRPPRRSNNTPNAVWHCSKGGVAHANNRKEECRSCGHPRHPQRRTSAMAEAEDSGRGRVQRPLDAPEVQSVVAISRTLAMPWTQRQLRKWERRRLREMCQRTRDATAATRALLLGRAAWGHCRSLRAASLKKKGPGSGMQSRGSKANGAGSRRPVSGLGYAL